MRNIKLTIEYDGKSLNGWQRQPSKLGIQGEIERSIFEITGEEVKLIASRQNRCRSTCASAKSQILKLTLIFL